MPKHLIFPLLFMSTSAFGSDEMAELLDLSLEEILKLKVVTVSKREESLADAPGVISVYSSEDISAFGAKNLKDVLLRIPNFYLFDSPVFNGTGITLRAGATQHINNHVLYLINGRPMRESQNGGRQSDINLLFPVTAIERIEVIRGPGSVLYGSNAFNGTINIITKKSTQDFTAALNVTAGSDNFKMLEASTSASSDSGANVNVQLKLLDEDGGTVTAIDSQLKQGTSQLYREGYFARLDGSYKGFELEVMSSELTLPNISGRYQWENLGEWTHKRDYLNLGYQHKFNQDWSSSLNYTLNKMSLDIIHPTPTKYLSDGYLFELTVNGNLNKNIDIVVGAVQDHIKGDLGSRGGRYNQVRNSMYAQLDYRFSFGTKLTTGVQVNKPENQQSHTSPRLALVHTFNNHWSMKALFSEAYRSPFGTEINFDSSFLQGDENLKPETIQTTELQVIYATPKVSLTSTIYQSQTNDLIGRSQNKNTVIFVNTTQEISYTGFELEGRWSITPSLQLQGNASHQENENETGVKDIMMASNNMVKLGLSYQTDFGVSAGIWNSYYGAVAKLEDLPNSSVPVVNPEAKAVNLLSLNIDTNVGELLNNSTFNTTKISLLANNLLDESIWFPEMAFKSVNTYPQSHEKSIFLTCSVNY